MKNMQLIVTPLALAVCMLFACNVASADWNPGDGHKMHSPQLPDPFGWDMAADILEDGDMLADDWRCSQSGPVSDIHVWGSWLDDDAGEITLVRVTIYDDIPAGQGGINYSRPGQQLWTRDFTSAGGDFTVRDYGEGLQGFHWPNAGVDPRPENHTEFHQINIEQIPSPYMQVEGTIYWVDVRVGHSASIVPWWGWKTSIEQWNDNAVWWDVDAWRPLVDPQSGAALDLAFVITPEPTTLFVMMAAGLPILLKRRRRRS